MLTQNGIGLGNLLPGVGEGFVGGEAGGGPKQLPERHVFSIQTLGVGGGVIDHVFDVFEAVGGVFHERNRHRRGDHVAEVAEQAGGGPEGMVQGVFRVDSLGVFQEWLQPGLEVGLERREALQVVFDFGVDGGLELVADAGGVLVLTVQVEHEGAEAHRIEPGFHHVECRLFLRHEQHGFAQVKAVGDHVGDGLGLAGAGRAFQHKAAALAGGHDGFQLRPVGGDGQRQGFLGNVDVSDVGVVQWCGFDEAFPGLQGNVAEDGGGEEFRPVRVDVFPHAIGGEFSDNNVCGFGDRERQVGGQKLPGNLRDGVADVQPGFVESWRGERRNVQVVGLF